MRTPGIAPAHTTALDRREIWRGFCQLLPLSAFVVVFGLAYGLAAAQSGLSPVSSVLMSALVFAGAAQFAVLDMWGAQVPLLPVAATVFAINARHLLMGASLYPWLRQLPPVQRYACMVVASDSNWALTMQALAHGQADTSAHTVQRAMGLLLGGGLALWLAWLLGSWLGLYVGSAIAEPKRWGLDMVMGCFLLAMVMGGPKNPRIVVIWLVAAAAALLAWRYLPENTHVVVGALAGGALGVWWPPKNPPQIAPQTSPQTMPEIQSEATPQTPTKATPQTTPQTPTKATPQNATEATPEKAVTAETRTTQESA